MAEDATKKAAGGVLKGWSTTALSGNEISVTLNFDINGKVSPLDLRLMPNQGVDLAEQILNAVDDALEMEKKNPTKAN